MSELNALETRRSLISRMRDVEDRESWQEFFDTYWRLIFSVARRAGLTEQESMDAVQETMILVARYIGEFRYDPGVCSFKTWLLQKTRWRIIDQVRKRPPDFGLRMEQSTDEVGEASTNHLPDPESSALDEVWEEEWRKNLVSAAMERVKHRIKPEHYQIFYLSAVRNLGPSRVAEAMGVGIARVYLVRHRVAAQIRREIRLLEQRNMR